MAGFPVQQSAAHRAVRRRPVSCSIVVIQDTRADSTPIRCSTHCRRCRTICRPCVATIRRAGTEFADRMARGSRARY
jgi:hypothetical protein